MTVCVFAWEDRARESAAFNRERIEQYHQGLADRPLTGFASPSHPPA